MLCPNCRAELEEFLGDPVMYRVRQALRYLHEARQEMQRLGNEDEAEAASGIISKTDDLVTQVLERRCH